MILAFAVANPMVFDVLVNVLQRFVYFQVLEANYPENVLIFFNIFGAAASLNLVATDSSQETKPSEFDQFLQVTQEDNAPPELFKELKMSSLVIKSSLPVYGYLGALYILGLILIILNGKIQVIERTQQQKQQ